MSTLQGAAFRRSRANNDLFRARAAASGGATAAGWSYHQFPRWRSGDALINDFRSATTITRGHG